MRQRFESEQWVAFPVELVFAFFANPSNLPHLMPPRLKTRIEDVRFQPPPQRPAAADPARRFKSLAAGAGSEILISFRLLPWLPFRIGWTARIVEFVWNSHFIDEQVRGPFARFRHRHGIVSERRNGEQGTLVTDAVEFTLPGGSAGSLAAPLVKKQLEQSFAFRRHRLPQVLAAAAQQAVQRA